jgi:hypothetical protein
MRTPMRTPAEPRHGPSARGGWFRVSGGPPRSPVSINLHSCFRCRPLNGFTSVDFSGPSKGFSPSKILFPLISTMFQGGVWFHAVRQEPRRPARNISGVLDSDHPRQALAPPSVTCGVSRGDGRSVREASSAPYQAMRCRHGNYESVLTIHKTSAAGIHGARITTRPVRQGRRQAGRPERRMVPLSPDLRRNYPKIDVYSIRDRPGRDCPGASSRRALGRDLSWRIAKASSRPRICLSARVFRGPGGRDQASSHDCRFLSLNEHSKLHSLEPHRTRLATERFLEKSWLVSEPNDADHRLSLRRGDRASLKM